MVEEKKGRKPRKGSNYYASRRMSKAEREELRKAGEQTGLDHEIALLRVRLKEALDAPPGDKQARRDVNMLGNNLDVLAKAIAVQHKVSPAKKGDLAESLAGTLQLLGDFILPAER